MSIEEALMVMWVRQYVHLPMVDGDATLYKAAIKRIEGYYESNRARMLADLEKEGRPYD